MYYGKCLCGSINIEISGPITDIIHCHCSLCRKSSGSAYSTNGFVNTSTFKVTSGIENLKEFSLESGRKRHFCITCGSPVYSSSGTDPDRVRLRLGILDSNIIERPSAHNFVSSKANWEILNTHLPTNEGHEAGRT